jgi:hypothetical protein
LVNDAMVETGRPQRVTNEVDADFRVAPQHVNPVLQVVAALIDNGLMFSNDEQTVTVRSRTVVHGIALEIEDGGVGMDQVALDAANEALSQEEATFEAMAQGRGRLGLFVVGQLAARHHMAVELRRSAYGGVKAIVMINKRVAVSSPGAPGAPPLPQPGRPRPPGASERGPLAAGAGDAGLPRRTPVAPRAPISEGLPAGDLPVRTAAGASPLPRRQAGAGLHPALVPHAPPPNPAAVPASASSPHQVASAWSSYQSGTRRAGGPPNHEQDRNQP